MTPALTGSVAHLSPGRSATANRLPVRKALAEFSHERLPAPTPLGDDRYTDRSEGASAEYRFTAHLFAPDHWQVEGETITGQRAGSELPL
ncbi:MULTISPECIES: hypothetical protein [Streptomyces]|uniref:hypothetical protein n=1 Tax=Streptomyces TaxID=1883 RepID=UPI0004C9E9A5|nr:MULTISPECIES: hypothetical protein [Streptomyces]RPK83542.1 hypothetical protein EES46_25305 [Streptomyces sp. ADI98-10]